MSTHPDLQVPLTEPELLHMEATERAATRGPWQWYGLLRSKSIELRSTGPWRLRVMDFARWGLLSGQPRFRVDLKGESARMKPVSELAPSEEGGFVNEVPHPDAEFIVASRGFIPRLLAEVRRCWSIIDQQEREIERLEALLSKRHISGEVPVLRPPSTR